MEANDEKGDKKMSLEKRFLARLKYYDRIASEQGWIDTWDGHLTEIIHEYLRECIHERKKATFEDFEMFIHREYDDRFVDD